MKRKSNDFAFCEKYLDKVSRTFAINIRILKGDAYKSILLAYLLCRIADTIEDDKALAPGFKIQKLHSYADLFPPSSEYLKNIDTFLSDIHFDQKSDETDLLYNLGRVYNELISLPLSSISFLSAHVKEMALGMALFQEKALHSNVALLNDQAELEQYCYYVAGTVGLMITDIFAESSIAISSNIKEKLHKRSIAFGIGLQLTNIAKDFFTDQSRGWCYVPLSFFTEANLDPRYDTYNKNPEAYMAVHLRMVTLALSFLDEAILYVLDIPRHLIRFRLFCLWPLFMAIETLNKLCDNSGLFTGKIIKISRNNVSRIIRNTSFAVMSNSVLISMYENSKQKINALLPSS